MATFIHFIAIIALLTLVFIGHVFAKPVDCDTVLLQKTSNITRFRHQSHLSWLLLITKENYDEIKKSASAELIDYFSGSYDSFRKKREQYLKKANYSKTTDEAREEVRVNLPEDAVPAWRDCVLSNSHGLFTWTDHIDEEGAILGIGWNPPPGLDKLKDVQVVLVGGNCVELTNDLKVLYRGTHTFNISRSGNKKDIRGSISGVTKRFIFFTTGTYSEPIYIPYPSKPKIVKKHKRWTLNGFGANWERENDCNVDTSDDDTVPVNCTTELYHDESKISLKVYFRCREDGGDRTKFEGTETWTVFEAPPGHRVLDIEGADGLCFSYHGETHGRNWGFNDFDNSIEGSYWQTLKFRVDNQGCDDDVVGVGGDLQITVVMEKFAE